MFSYLQGKIAEKSPTELVIDVNGVGYLLNISLSTFEKLSIIQNTVKVFTYLHVREDALQLFGFATESERNMFKMLISITGIGPKMAQGILSGMNAEELKTLIQHGNIAALTSIQGIGKKTAERLVVELRDKIGKTELGTIDQSLSVPQIKMREDALNALISLGYSRSTAEQVIRQILKETSSTEITTEEIIKYALRHSTK